MNTDEKVLDKLERIRKNTSIIVTLISIPWVVSATIFVFHLLSHFFNN